MRSTHIPGDLSTPTQIREAAISCIAEHGLAATTARKVAAAAGVSPGLVVHHFTSMSGLREACDRHVARQITEQKLAAIAEGDLFDPLSAFTYGTSARYAGYLAAVLADDSPAVAHLVDDLVDDAEELLARAEADGHVRPSDDPRARAAVLLLWALGPLVLHHHSRRLLGVDMTDLDNAETVDVKTYASTLYELLGNGLFTERFTTHMREAMRKERP